MNDLVEQTEPIVAELLKADEDQLYIQLGIRAKALAVDPSISGSFDPDVTYDEAEMGVLDDVREFGKLLFRRWNRELNQLICGSDPDSRKERTQLAKALGIGDAAAAAYISVLLVTSFGLAPALAAVAAAIIIKHIFRPTVEEFCSVWQARLGA
jgi:hypothetical protein